MRAVLAGLAVTLLGTSVAAQVRVDVERVIASSSDVRGKAVNVLAALSGRRHEPLFNRPYGLAWDGDDILVSDPAGHRVIRIGRSGATASADGALEDPVGIAVCGSGIVVTDTRTGRVALLDARLRVVRWLAERLARPTGVACTSNRIFVVETGAHRLLEIDAHGGILRTIGERGPEPGQFNFPTAVAIAGTSLFVGDTLNFRVQQLDLSTGRFVAAFGTLGDAAGDTPRIKGVAVDEGGRIWVSDGYLDQLAVYTATGAFITDIGRTGHSPGEFALPAGVAAHASGRVAVADSLNRRVQVLRVVPGASP